MEWDFNQPSCPLEARSPGEAVFPAWDPSYGATMRLACRCLPLPATAQTAIVNSCVLRNLTAFRLVT